MPAVITIGIDPNIHLGPITLAWHGVTIAIGVAIGALVAGRLARARGLDSDPLYAIAGLLVVGGLVGGRLFYVREHGGPLLGTHGYTFDGGMILAAVLIAGYVWRRALSGRYLDVVAIGLPLGVAIGRIGDVINGEHYGKPRGRPIRALPEPRAALAPGPAADRSGASRRAAGSAWWSVGPGGA